MRGFFNKEDIPRKKPKWDKEWQDMPEFVQEDLTSCKSIIVHFDNKEDVEKFSKLVEQKIAHKTKSIWYPKTKLLICADKVYIDEP